MHVLFVFHVGNFTCFLLYIAMVLWFNSIIVKDKRKVIYTMVARANKRVCIVHQLFRWLNKIELI